MYNLLKIEFMKLRKSKEFRYIFLGICLISIGLMSNEIYCMEVLLRKMNPEVAVNGLDFYGEMINGKIYMEVLQNILIIIFICKDFEKRIVQSEYLAGYSRFEILMSKVIICFFIKAVLTFFFAFISTAGISILYGLGQELTFTLIFKILRMYSLSVLISCGIATVAIMISYIFKTISVSVLVWVGVFFGYLIGMTVLGEMFKSAQSLQYLVDNSIFEFYRMVKLDMFSGDIIYIISMSSLRIFIVLVITYIIFRKTELR